MISKSHIKGDKFLRVLNQINIAQLKRQKILYVTKFKNIEKFLYQLQKAKILCNFSSVNNMFFLLLHTAYYNQKIDAVYFFQTAKKIPTISHLQKILFKKKPQQMLLVHTKQGITVK